MRLLPNFTHGMDGLTGYWCLLLAAMTIAGASADQCQVTGVGDTTKYTILNVSNVEKCSYQWSDGDDRVLATDEDHGIALSSSPLSLNLSECLKTVWVDIDCQALPQPLNYSCVTNCPAAPERIQEPDPPSGATSTRMAVVIVPVVVGAAVVAILLTIVLRLCQFPPDVTAA